MKSMRPAPQPALSHIWHNPGCMNDCDADRPLLTRSSCLHGDDRTASKPHGGLSIEIGCASIIDQPARNEPKASVSSDHENHEPQEDLNAASLAQFGSLVSHASRVNMRLGLLDGSATTARELAATARGHAPDGKRPPCQARSGGTDPSGAGGSNAPPSPCLRRDQAPAGPTLLSHERDAAARAGFGTRTASRRAVASASAWLSSGRPDRGKPCRGAAGRPNQDSERRRGPSALPMGCDDEGGREPRCAGRMPVDLVPRLDGRTPPHRR